MRIITIKQKRRLNTGKRYIQTYFPFKWHRDNYTKNLSNYYGFSKVNSEKGFLVLELGEITCNRQVKWAESLN